MPPECSKEEAKCTGRTSERKVKVESQTGGKRDRQRGDRKRKEKGTSMCFVYCNSKK